ncbi:MAG: 50S ribosomal protein L24 [Verrucomicrobia bacterium]|nr:50S ribosomal protein L24 [Verrucomicrobiota bacterium]
MSKRIKKDDKVVILTGNDKGRTGTVLRYKGDRVIVQGINIRKKHVKRREKVQTPSIIEMEMPLHISNIALCDDEGKAVKVRARIVKGGAKELYYKKGDKETVLRKI